MAAYELWDRQPDETSKAYALFAHYRDLGPMDRTLVKVAREYGRQPSTIEKLSRVHNWVPRVTAWDAENERVKRLTQVKELEQMARRQMLAGQLFQSKGLKRIQAMTDEDVGFMSLWEAIRLYETGVRLERIGRGEPDPMAPIAATQVNVALGSSTMLIDIMRKYPTRVGPVLQILDQLRAVVPELAQGEAVYYEGESTEVQEPDDPDLFGQPEPAAQDDDE